MSTPTVTTVTTTERVARKAHRCDGCGEGIKPGDKYLEHRYAPNRSRGRDEWQTKTECLACAGRLGRRSDQALEHYATPLFDPEAIA
jgi:hypothetical protein